jgi:hypothetical protein
VIYGNADTNRLLPGKPDEMLIQIDSIGKLEWLQIYAAFGVGIGKDAIQNPDGTYLSIGTNNSYGIGGYAMHLQHIGLGGYWIAGQYQGGTADQQGNSIAVAKNGNAYFAGTTDSPGFSKGLYDIMLIRCKSDTLQNVHPFTVKNFYDTSFCTLGIDDQVVMHPEVKIYPNPVSSSATILVQGDIGSHYTLNVQNISGELILHGMAMQCTAHGQSICHIEKGNFPEGIYFYEIINQTGIVVATGKFIIE